MGSRAKRRTIAGPLLLAVALAMALGACGGGDEEAPPPTTVPSDTPDSVVTPTTIAIVAPPATPTTVRAGAAAPTCASLAARASDLFQRWRNDMRGVAGPQNEAEHVAEGRALLAEARRLGCPVPAGVEGMIEG